MSFNKFLIGAAAMVIASSGTIAQAQKAPDGGTETGPSSSQSPYVVPVAPGVFIKSIMSVGESVNNKPDGTPYRMVGIPDGLGAFNTTGNTFTVLMNHELRPDAGVVRAHGATGAFISRLIVGKKNLRVLEASDLIQSAATWNVATSSYNAPAKGVVFNRFCSADLPLQYAFFNPVTRTGTLERLFMNGEEAGVEGRAFAHAMNGVSYELPRLGKFSWENSLAHPYTGDKTVVVGTDDSTPGQVYVYIGTKMRTGSVVDRAGLTNGQLYGIKVEGYPAEDSATGIPDGTRFSLQPLGDVSNKSGAQLETDSTSLGVTRFLRPEDGHWNLNNWNEFMFVTTNAFGRPSRLWSLNFDNAFNPEQGGTIEMVLNGSEGQQMLDNMTLDLSNRVLLQEDPGSNPYLAKVRMLNLLNGEYTVLAEHDPLRFTPPAVGETPSATFLTQDEEASGIIDVRDILGNGWYLMSDQIHRRLADPELVEDGQLLAMYVPTPTGGSNNPYPRGSLNPRGGGNMRP
jgi:hypothetical protein